MLRPPLRTLALSALAVLASGAAPLALPPPAWADVCHVGVCDRVPAYDCGPCYYDIVIRNDSGRWLRVYVHYKAPAGYWNTRVYCLDPGQADRIDAQTRNPIIYFRAEGDGYLANGGPLGVVTSDGRRYKKNYMGPAPRPYTYAFH